MSAGRCLFPPPARALDEGLCLCVTCAIARQADKRDARSMLRAERIRLAGVTPKQRADWDEYLEATRHA